MKPAAVEEVHRIAAEAGIRPEATEHALAGAAVAGCGRLTRYVVQPTFRRGPVVTRAGRNQISGRGD